MAEVKYNAKEIFAFNQTEAILRSQAKDINKNFYHYTTVTRLNNILSGDNLGNHFLFVRNISDMNDQNEAKLHKSDGNRIHSFCTCCTKHEKIPLWYLYSGICGDGARLGFTPGKMLQFLNSIDTVYPVDGFSVRYEKPLKLNRDFEMHCGWVYYLMDGNNRVLYKNSIYTVETMDEETIKSNYFTKNYPWEFEREFRIVIKNKTEETYERIALPIPEKLIPTLEIMSAPEYEFSQEERDRFLSYGIKSDKIKKSKLNIKMKLLYNHREHIVEQIDNWCEDEYCERLCEYICSRKKCHKLGLK